MGTYTYSVILRSARPVHTAKNTVKDDRRQIGVIGNS